MNTKVLTIAFAAGLFGVALVSPNAVADRNRAVGIGAMGAVLGHGHGSKQFSGIGQGGLIRQLATQGMGSSHGRGGRELRGGIGQGGLLQQLATQSMSSSHGRSGRELRGGIGQGGLLQQLATQGMSSSHGRGGGQFRGGFGQGGLLQQLVTQGMAGGGNGYGGSRHCGNGGQGMGPFGGGYGGAPILNALQGLGQWGPAWGGGPCGWPAGGYGAYGYGPGPYYGPRDQYADAYRDVGIANAVAGVVSNLAAISVQNGPGYAVPVATYAPAAPVVAAPAPVAVVPSAPVGRYETQQVIVSPGHYEEVRVQIPQSVDPRTGAAVGGYTEVRQRWVPEVVEYRPVWVVQ